MIAVIFEAWPGEGQRDSYFDLATRLRPLLAEVPGLISIERYGSLSEPGKLLSLSFWRDEASVTAWRQLEAHRAAQAAGRARIFDNYRLRVAAVARDYGPRDRAQAPEDSRVAHDGAIAPCLGARDL